MIQIITLNPAMDRTLTLDELLPGNVLRATQVVSMAGGKGINVARFLKQLAREIEIEVIGFSGGATGGYIQNECEQMGVTGKFIDISAPNRVCFTILEPDRTTVINEPGPVISQDELLQFWNVLKESQLPDVVLLSGSAPPGIPDNFYADVIRYYKGFDLPVFLDTSAGYLAEGIRAEPFFVKPNESEFRELINLKEGSFEELVVAAQQFINYGVQNMAISFGERGLVYVTGDGGPFYIPALKIKAVNPIASGDAFMAGMIYSMTNGGDMEYSLKFATAAAAMNAVNSVPSFSNPEDIKDWALKVEKYNL